LKGYCRSIFFVLFIVWHMPGLTCLCCVRAEEPVPQILTLDQCVDLSFRVSSDLENAERQLILDDIRIHEAKQKRWPTTSLTLSDNRVIDVEQFSYYDPQTGQSFIPGEGYTASIGLQTPVYTGGKITAAIRYAGFQRRIDELTHQKLERDIWLEVVSAYLEILERKSERDVRREQVLSAQDSLNLAQKRVMAGRGIKYEVLLERAYLADAELELLRTENALRKAKRSLLLLIRKPLDLDFQLEDIEIPDPLKIQISELVEEAFTQREDIEKLNVQIASLNEQLKIVKANRKPDVSLFANFSKQGENWSDYSNDDSLFTAGLSISFSPFDNSSLSLSGERERVNSDDYMQRSRFSFSLFDGSSQKSNRFELQMQIFVLESQLSDVKAQIYSSIAGVYERQNESWKASESEQYKLEAAAENFQIQTKRFELGLNQYNDLVEARTNLVTSRINLHFARYKYTLDRAILDHAVGSTLWRNTP
jgi:outer membrane protein